MAKQSSLKHIAIVMDGNGRWAKKRKLPRFAGHQAGYASTRRTVEACVTRGIEVLTIYAFSSENWWRPTSEINFLMRLFQRALYRELPLLQEKNVRLRVIGNRENFSKSLRKAIHTIEKATSGNTGMTLLLAASYGGRDDIVSACNDWIEKSSGNPISEEQLVAHLSTADYSDPDLFIRTSGEMRLSNFLLWQLAYTELYFTPVLWPDFTEKDLDEAIHAFRNRERRYGKVDPTDEEFIDA